MISRLNRLRSSKLLGLVLIALSCCGFALFASVADEFKSASQLYDAGKFAEAAERLGAIEPKTANVYFNLGNACFRHEELGLAILNYERARRLAPRDPDILANLRFAEQRLGVEEINAAPHATRRLWQSLVASRAANEWAAYELAGVWLTVLAVAGWLWLPKLRGPFVVVGLAAGVWLVAVASAFGYQILSERAAPAAIVLAVRADARFAPMPDATVHFQLGEGTKVFIRENRGPWNFVERADGQQGWVKSESLERIAGR